MSLTYLLSILLLIIVQNCAPQLEPSFEKSNQVFLENTIDDLKLSQNIDSKIDKNNSIAIVSIENNLTKDQPLTSLIEDYMIKNLVTNGYKIYERDLDALINIVRESKNNKYSLSHDQWDYGIASPLYDAWPAITDSIAITRYNIPNDGLQLYSTQLSSADFVLSYRVLEIGIMYTPIIDNTSYPKDKREGRIRLNYRIQDTKTGQVVDAGTLDGKYYDEIRSDQKESLSDYHYSFFGYEYPNSKPWWKKNDNAIIDKQLSKPGNLLLGAIVGANNSNHSTSPIFGGYFGGESNFGKIRLEYYANDYVNNGKISIENRLNYIMRKLFPNIDKQFLAGDLLFKVGIGAASVKVEKEISSDKTFQNNYYFYNQTPEYWNYESSALTIAIGKQFQLGKTGFFIHAESNIALDDPGATNTSIRFSLGK